MKALARFGLCSLAVVAAACGGGATPTKSPHDGKAEPKDSIAAAAAAQGGIAALGGAGNREDSGATGVEVAMTGTLKAEWMGSKTPVKLDGVLKEWGDRAPAKETIAGSTENLAFGVAVLYDAERMYVAAEVSDPKLARTREHGDGDSHVTMTLAFPEGRGALKAYTIGLWPGKPGETSGVVKWVDGPNKGKDVAGTKLVENDAAKGEKPGFTFEASIPWSTFPESRTMRVGLRAAFRYYDANKAILATGAGTADKPDALPPLPTGSEQAVVDGLLAPKNLAGTPPKIDVFADVTGDERKERVSVFGKFFTICGPGYRGGRQFFWREVAGDLVALETRDVTGDGHDDFVVKRRILTGTAVHDVLEVWTIGQGDEPTTIFAHQIAVASNDGKKRVVDSVRVSAKEIEIAVEPAVGWDASSFHETVASDVEGILLPWGAVKSRTFKLEKGKFAKASEVAQTPTATAKAEPGHANEPTPRDVPTPAVAKPAADYGKQVLDAYYRDANVPTAQKPRFDLEVHVDGDAKPERVLLVGRDVVVLGPAFKGGTGYARLSLTQFADEKDVSEITARDVTGDGAAEIVVRGTRRVEANGEKIDVDALFLYQVKSGNIVRVFSIETGRESAGKRVQGLVQFVPAKGGKGFDIDVRPGLAKGWSEKTYPWPQDKPGGAIEPLLLPWGKIASLRYSWNGSTFVTP